MLMKTIGGIAFFAAIGGAVGYSKILCAGGECAITGTPYGGAFFGGMIGLVVMSGMNSGTTLPQSIEPTDDASEDESGGDEPRDA